MSFTTDVEALEIDLLLEAIFQRFGNDFRNRQKHIIHRKLRSFMDAHSIARVSVLQNRVLHDPSFIDPLLCALEARSVGLFDSPEQMLKMRKVFLPWLRSCAAPKIWIAECTAAEDVYGLVTLLMEDDLYQKTHVYVTGSNISLLGSARESKFSASLFKKYERNYRLAGGRGTLLNYCEKVGDAFVFHADLQSNITWAHFNIGTDASFNEFEIIVCSSGFNDFTLRSQHRALQVFYDSQPNFGLLTVVGPNSLEISPLFSHYKALSIKYGLYQRVSQ